jgi:signal transduction histidine kinase
MRSLPERRRTGLAALAAGIAALGIAAASQGFAWPDTRSWVPDLLTGWTLCSLGLVVVVTGRSGGAGRLLLAAGLAWFLGDFHATAPHLFGVVASHLSWVFVAPLVQLALAYPSGRPRAPVTTVAVATTWLATLTPWLNWNDNTTLATATGALTLVGVATSLRVPRLTPTNAGGLGALFLLLAWALTVPRLHASLQPIAFDAGVALVGVWLFAWLPQWRDLAERAIELDESTETLGDALAELLGDPALKIGFATDGAGFIDDLGRAVPASEPGRKTTEVADVSGLIGIIVHDPRVLSTAAECAELSVAVALAATRAQLREDLRRRADEISRSTVRLIRAGDEERIRLSERLDARSGRCLRDAARLLDEARATAGGEAELEASLDHAAGQLRRARRELSALAGGLGATALADGLSKSVAELVENLPLEVETHITDLDCGNEVAATIWFVCAEGVTNVLKHAAASRLVLEVRETPSGVRVLVEDDGRGAGDADGSGLAGLRDRVAALGGHLRVETSRDGGTSLRAWLPNLVDAA